MNFGKLIGIGATAEVYDCGGGRVFKQFHADKSEDCIRYEYHCNQAVQNTGVRVPKLYELMLEQEAHGYYMEYVHGESLLEHFIDLMQQGDNTEELSDCCKEFAKIQYQIHQATAGDLPDGKEWLKERIKRTHDLTDEEKGQLMERIDQLPQHSVLCHNDYHPGNLLMTEDGYCVIDWCDAASGDAWMDIARTYLVFQSVNLPDGISKEAGEQLNQARRQMGEVYLKEYLRLSKRNAEELKKWMPVVAASRLHYETGKDKEIILAMVRKFLQES